MIPKTYDITKLATSGKFDTTIVQRFFYHVRDYYDALTDFVENYGRCLKQYTPAFVVNSEEERKTFLAECSQLRAKFVRLGATSLLEALSNIEDAAVERNFKGFSDGQITFAATMEIYVNIVKDAETKDPVKHKKKDSGEKKKTPVIMIIDPLLGDLSQMVNLLHDKFQVLCCPDGQSAMASLRARTPDLFIVCAQMPGISGYEFGFLVRSAGLKAPIWFMTDKKAFDPVKACMPNDATEYILKPIDESKFLDKLQQHFSS